MSCVNSVEIIEKFLFVGSIVRGCSIVGLPWRVQVLREVGGITRRREKSKTMRHTRHQEFFPEIRKIDVGS